MENSFEYRIFLMCNNLANRILNLKYQNFAELIIEEQEQGRYANRQMTYIFDRCLNEIADIIANEHDFIWDVLDMKEVAKIPAETLLEDYSEYCLGNENFLSFDLATYRNDNVTE